MKGSVLATRITFVLLLFSLSIPDTLQAQPDGAALFKAQCAQCHSTGDNKVIGPGLKNLHTRRTEAWLLPWIKNSQAVIKSGDAYAVKLYNEYNQTAMPSFSLSDDEIKSILAYVKAEGEKAPAAAPGAAAREGRRSGSTTIQVERYKHESHHRWWSGGRRVVRGAIAAIGRKGRDPHGGTRAVCFLRELRAALSHQRRD